MCGLNRCLRFAKCLQGLRACVRGDRCVGRASQCGPRHCCSSVPLHIALEPKAPSRWMCTLGGRSDGQAGHCCGGDSSPLQEHCVASGRCEFLYLKAEGCGFVYLTAEGCEFLYLTAEGCEFL